MSGLGDGANYAPETRTQAVVAPGEFCFAAAHLDHGHIYGMVQGLLAAGGTLTAVYDPSTDRVRQFQERFPQAQAVPSLDHLLRDESIRLIAAAAVPCDRAALGGQVLRAGKDYFTDKSPFTSLSQLEQARRVVAQTGGKYLVYYAERLHNEAAWQAGEMIAAGAVGRVLQVVNLAPHRLAEPSRPDWFFDKAAVGGILTDIGSHQVEQFLTFAGCVDASVNFARVANFGHPHRPGFEDFGELSLTGDNGASFYTRVDWYTPDGSPVWGDGRTFILGTDGTLELRKYTDPGRTTPAALILHTDVRGVHAIDCQGRVGFPFFGRLVLDCLHRTELAMTQEHAFRAAEISMRAQELAEG